MMFKKHHIHMILEGLKTQTRRKGKMRHSVGKVYGIRCQWFERNKYFILITRRFRERLGDISEADAKKEGYGSIANFKKAWLKINGSWDPEEIVTAYEFKLAAVVSNDR